MASVAAGEEFCHLIRNFSSDLRNLPVVRGIGDFFSNLFNFRPQSRHRGRSDALSPSVVENLIVPGDEAYEVDIRNLFPEKKENQNHGDERDPHAVFNVLDMVLVETMERLKKLREGFRMVSRYSFHQGIASVLHSGFRFASDSDGALIRMLCSSGKINAALELHSNLLGNHMVPDLYTHNILMNGLCKMGDLLTATFLLERMAGVGVFPNTVTYNTLIEGCCRWDHIDKALDLVSSMSQSGVGPDIVTCNTLVHALCTRGLREEIHAGKLAEILEEHYEESNVITSTILMHGCCRQGDIIQALELWNEMFEKGIKIDRIAFNVLINGFCLVQDMKVAYRYFSEMFKRGFLPDVVTFNTLISGFARKGSIHEACDIHNRMEPAGLRPDGISYKLVIQALCQQGNITEAISFLCKMLNDQLTPDRRTWNLIITSYARYGDISGAYSTRDMMVAMGVVPNVFTYNALIHANVKAGNIRRALLLKKEMLANGIFPDAVTYNLLIGAAFNSEHNADPLIPKIWKFQPDIFTYTMWIRGLCQQRRIREAGMMFNKLLRSGLPVDHVPFQILIKSYCKRGKVIEALDLYEKMTRKQICWTRGDGKSCSSYFAQLLIRGPAITLWDNLTKYQIYIQLAWQKHKLQILPSCNSFAFGSSFVAVKLLSSFPNDFVSNPYITFLSKQRRGTCDPTSLVADAQREIQKAHCIEKATSCIC